MFSLYNTGKLYLWSTLLLILCGRKHEIKSLAGKGGGGGGANVICFFHSLNFKPISEVCKKSNCCPLS